MNASMMATASAASRDIEWTVVRGVLWQQWQAHKKVIGFYTALWLVGIWILPSLVHPYLIAAFATLYSAYVGDRFGGGHIIDGSEEFGLTLPVTRETSWVARFLFSGLLLAAFVAVGLAAYQFNWPAEFWRLFVESGLTGVKFSAEGEYLVLKTVTWSAAVFSTSFALSALKPRASRGNPAGVLLVGAATIIAMAIQYYVPRLGQHWLPIATQSAIALLMPVIGLALYRWKEIGPDDASQKGSSMLSLILIAIIILVLAGFVVFAA